MNYFENLASWLIESGFITFLVPALISFTFFYILFERIKLANKFLNALLAFSICLLIFVFPLISGMNIAIAMSYFLAQSFSFIFVFAIGMLIASLFYPDFPQKLARFFRTRGILAAVLGLVIVLFLSSGFLSILFQSYSAPSAPLAGEKGRLTILIALLVIFSILLLLSARIR